ncbi:MAG: transglycosylase domain-containing protein, partial [Bacteroidota bacterium]
MLNRKYIKILVAITILFGLWFIITPLPDPVFDDPYATTLLAEDGTLLNASIADDMQWRFPPSDSLPDKFKTAIRLYEDEYFYYHFGVNPVSIVRAISQNIEAGEIVSGGSTLSMQTIRMSLGNKERTYWQKFVEVMATFKLELLYSKEDIMKTYADHAPFGGNIVGLKAASYRYYNRSPFQLSWAETAVLAVLPNHPASIFPGRNDKLLRQKRDQLLTKLKNKGILTDDELEMAMAEPLPGKKKSLPQLSYHLLHRAIKDGAKGTNIHSTLDANLQVRVNRAVESHSKKMAANHIYNAAAVVIEISSGKTLAYTGNSDNPGIHGQHVDVITALRSPGSLLKPILYASAIDEGLILPQQLLKDIPLFYEGFNPKNFNKKYKGAVPANEALTSSLNVPFVHLLIAHGHEKFLQKLKNVGFESFSHAPDHYGLSMILGGAETSLWEIT